MRHCWCWEKRWRPHLPIWSCAKMPSARLSPEENGRLLCMYMRPWTLQSSASSKNNPLLSQLGLCEQHSGQEIPVFLSQTVRTATTQTLPSGNVRKRRRGKQPVEAPARQSLTYYSYARSWEAYIDGNVVSESSRRYITNMLACTQSMQEDAQDSSDDSDEEKWKPVQTAAGSMQVVNRILSGLAARSADDGSKGFGRYAGIIRMGRALWQTPALTPEQAEHIAEVFCDDGRFPNQEQCKAAWKVVRSKDEQLASPFEGKTMPYCHLSVHDYGGRMEAWIQKLKTTSPGPELEDLNILQDVCERIKVEFELESVGCTLPKEDARKKRRKSRCGGLRMEAQVLAKVV